MTSSSSAQCFYAGITGLQYNNRSGCTNSLSPVESAFAAPDQHQQEHIVNKDDITESAQGGTWENGTLCQSGDVKLWVCSVAADRQNPHIFGQSSDICSNALSSNEFTVLSLSNLLAASNVTYFHRLNLYGRSCDILHMNWKVIIVNNESFRHGKQQMQGPTPRLTGDVNVIFGSASKACFVQDHLFTISNEGTLASFRVVDDGQLCKALDIVMSDIVIDLDATETDLLLVTESGSAKICESVSSGSKSFVSMLELPLNTKIKNVSCGKEHVVMLSSFGAVFSFGNSSRGQLGHGSLNKVPSPKVIKALEGISMVQVDAGGWHNLALSDIGDIYAWGWNESGQVGVPCLKKNDGSPKEDNSATSGMVMCPTLLFSSDTDIEFDDISCGSRHSAAVTREGVLYTWGWNGYKQLFSDHAVLCDTPSVVDFFKVNSLIVKSVQCGGWSTIVFAQPANTP